VVTAPRGVQELPSPEEFALVPVWYRRDAEPAPVSPRPHVGGRSVPIGAGVYNFDANERMANRRLASRVIAVESASVRPGGGADGGYFQPEIGTLGCFLQDRAGKRYLISNCHVLSPHNRGETGDHIFLEGTGPERGDRHIARLTKFIPLRYDGGGNKVDVAVAELEADVEPDYSALTAAGIKLGDPVDPQQGDEVLKVGRTSGLTRGVITQPKTSMDMTLGGSERLVYEECCEVVGITGSEFSLAGDSGAVIIRARDGRVVAHLFGSARRHQGAAKATMGCLFTATLKMLDGMKLLRRTATRRSDRWPPSSSSPSSGTPGAS
jgi:hypothetical protein